MLLGLRTPGMVLQVNAAVDDVAALAEANMKLVAAARGRGTSLSVEDRRHAQSLIRNVAVRSMFVWRSGAQCVQICKVTALLLHN